MIEISDGKAEYKYRLNPYNKRIIDFKRNVHRATWQPLKNGTFATEEEANAALVQLYRKETPK